MRYRVVVVDVFGEVELKWGAIVVGSEHIGSGGADYESVQLTILEPMSDVDPSSEV